MNFERVSKQWKRCLFKKQYQLRITDVKKVNSYEESSTIELPINTIIKFYQNNYKTVIEVIETFLQKCAPIKHINFAANDLTFEGKILFDTLLDNCAHITSITFNWDYYSRRMVKYFGHKLGAKLTSIEFPKRSTYCRHFFYESDGPKSDFLPLIKMCPNLTRIANANISYICSGDLQFNMSPRVIAPKLCEVIRLNGCDEKDVRIDVLMKEIAVRYRVKHFDLYIDYKVVNQDIVLDGIARFTNLEKLKLKLSLYQFFALTPLLVEKIATIGSECTKIVYLDIDVPLNGLRLVARKTLSLVTAIQHFKRLTHLKLILPYYENVEKSEELTVNLLEDCKHLTHIHITATINDNFFLSIHEYLPKLSQITINTNKQLTDEMMASVSKLKDLTSLKIGISDTHISLITAKGIYEILNNCLHIKSVTLKPMPNLSIEYLKQIAIEWYRTNFTYYCFEATLSYKDRIIKNYESCNVTFREYCDYDESISDEETCSESDSDSDFGDYGESISNEETFSDSD